MPMRGLIVLTVAFFVGVILHAKKPGWFNPGLAKVGLAG